LLLPNSSNLEEKFSLLKKISDDFFLATGALPLIASEIEFYLSDSSCLAAINDECRDRSINIAPIEKESGEGQYEISVFSLLPPLRAAETINDIKNIISSCAEKYKAKSFISSKPFEQQPGCGLHINISLHDKNGKNLFNKNNDKEETQALLYSVGGLMATMSESMLFLAPLEESYKRFTAEHNIEVSPDEPMQKYNNAPVNISWGGNNRTTAIRIPASTAYPENRHIEHRVSCADADPYLAISAVLAGIEYGIIKKITPPPKIYGNAFDKQYDLPSLPQNLEQAKKAYRKGKVINGYLKL